MTAPHTLSSLLPPERVEVGLHAQDKEGLLHAMVRLASRGGMALDADLLLKDVMERERLISTGVGQGLALPHARTNAVPHTIAALAVLEAPVEYESLDGAPVRIAVLLAGPEEERTSHLRLLSRVSRVMADAETRHGLLEAESVRSVLRIIAEAESSIA